jgi:hypothetical protein
MPPLFLLGWCVDRLLALQLRAWEDTVSLLVALEAKSLLMVPLALQKGESSNDGIEINSTNAWRRSATASTSTSTTMTTTKL